MPIIALQACKQQVVLAVYHSYSKVKKMNKLQIKALGVLIVVIVLIIVFVVMTAEAREINGVATSKMTIPNHSNGGGDDVVTEKSLSSRSSGSQCIRYEMTSINGQPAPLCILAEDIIDMRCKQWMAGGDFCN